MDDEKNLLNDIQNIIEQLKTEYSKDKCSSIGYITQGELRYVTKFLEGLKLKDYEIKILFEHLKEENEKSGRIKLKILLKEVGEIMKRYETVRQVLKMDHLVMFDPDEKITWEKYVREMLKK